MFSRSQEFQKSKYRHQDSCGLTSILCIRNPAVAVSRVTARALLMGTKTKFQVSEKVETVFSVRIVKAILKRVPLLLATRTKAGTLKAVLEGVCS